MCGVGVGVCARVSVLAWVLLVMCVGIVLFRDRVGRVYGVRVSRAAAVIVAISHSVSIVGVHTYNLARCARGAPPRQPCLRPLV